ncbi:MAG: DUF4434 family protein [Zymomonas mobilis subsp. pomaceae]|uniref:DUF4434 family protein n=1 Tax=Zymomonas mobilis TaxID=542 RepID=UPI0001B7063C|nr:DUF4434 family protein [Zymomonas mobilis]ACV76387.1 conserved hypothetical protein [Zymomonas mobilis subsp. mobilis NCIMB 11163]
MRILARFIALIVALLIASSAQAEKGIFYQPQEKDSHMSAETWERIWNRLHHKGFDTVYIQWTSYGSNDFGGAKGWLRRNLALAQGASINLVVGLYLDPDYGKPATPPLDPSSFEAYWKAQIGNSIAQWHHIENEWNIPVKAVYLPMELDDIQFMDPIRRDILSSLLKAASHSIDKPIHISAFGNGRMSPYLWNRWLNDLNAFGIRTWWQDGNGIKKLDPFILKEYQQNLDCKIGIIQEIFIQKSKENEPFLAEGNKEIPKPISCHPNALFSLRYLIPEFFK